MVQSHNDHNNTTQRIDRMNPEPAACIGFRYKQFLSFKLVRKKHYQLRNGKNFLINSLPTNSRCKMKKTSIPFLNTKTSYFYDKSPIMKWIKLTAFTTILFAFLLSISSCEKNDEKKIQTDFSKTSIVLGGAQETPSNPSPATGSMDVFYTRETRILSYTVKWSGLTGNPILMHIHGLAPTGFAANVVQTILSAANPTAFPANNGKYSGTLLVDGVVVKEQDLLNGLYYMNIHTPTYPGGEIRGQIVFQ